MNRQDAFKALMAAGEDKATTAFLAERSESAARTYDAIRQDPNLSDAYRKQQLAIAYASTYRDAEKELITRAQRVVHNDRDDAERVLGIKGLPGDVASLTISRREAGDRVAAITDVTELRDLLRRATRSGDEVLARAIAERAVDNQDDKTMNQFLADRPDLDEAGTRLWNSQRSTNSFALTAAFSGLIPQELVGFSIDAVDRLAAEPPTSNDRATAAGLLSGSGSGV